MLYGRYKNAVYRYVLKSVQDATCAEDICHEAWLSVIDKADTFRPDEKIQQPFKQWLYRIAHNKLIDFWRKQKNFQVYDDEPKQEDEQSANEAPLEQQYLIIEIERKLAELPPLQQQSYALQIEGFSLAEIAQITGSPAETVKSRIRYSKQKIKQLIEGEL
ncbi:MAG: sigma-70 family RNA polymerase sigma factor [Cellvibrionaceae bacterium]|nr:sigma-70 family RNA polymerase sigma factor [Cellvibrionaceae bacterium]